MRYLPVKHSERFIFIEKNEKKFEILKQFYGIIF